DTSVVGAGQLAAAIGITWGITAPLVGPISDIYGRRKVALTGVTLIAAGTLGSLLAWDYWALLGCRLLIGIGAAMIPPNSMASIGIFTYFVAFLVTGYGLRPGATALPLALVGVGAMLGSLIGGRVAGRPQRLLIAGLGLATGGIGVGLAFASGLSPWAVAVA